MGGNHMNDLISVIIPVYKVGFNISLTYKFKNET